MKILSCANAKSLKKMLRGFKLGTSIRFFFKQRHGSERVNFVGWSISFHYSTEEQPPSPCSNPCSSGRYSLGGALSCTACPEGYRCPLTDQGPQLCPSGYYSASESTNCTACEAGYQCPNTLGKSWQWVADHVSPGMGYWCDSRFKTFVISSEKLNSWLNM